MRVLLPLLLVAHAAAFAPSPALLSSSLASRSGALSASRVAAREPKRLSLRMGEPLKSIELKHPSGSSATVYPFGATVTSYKAPHEVLFVRPDAKFDGSKPISGGIPHCFPQFGPGKIQQHGFARNLVWNVKDVSADEPDMPSVTLELTETEETMAMWPNKFKCTYVVGLDEEKLNCELRVTNTDSKPWDFQAALHTYFAVSNIDKCEVRGAFKGSEHLNRMDKPPSKTKESREAIRFDKEVDSCYEGVSGQVVLFDEVKPEQSVTIRNLAGWEDTVLWNPYGNEGMGYKNFACVESVKAAKPAVLAAGETWISRVSIIPGAAK
mmetsp:Transcript_13777/g.47685  ORF Transcript_13777/g.47685 Transcript_13777/m.47685 type:complete len:324 (-) Transcript_13777:104-1075(-)